MSTATKSEPLAEWEKELLEAEPFKPTPMTIAKPRYRTITNADGMVIRVPDYESETRAQEERDEARERVRALRGNPRPGRPRPYEFGRDDYRIGSRDAVRSFAEEARAYDRNRYGGGMPGPEADGCSCEDCRRKRGEGERTKPCEECARLKRKVSEQDKRIIAQVDATQKIDKEADALAAEYERVVEQNNELRESIEWYSNEILIAWGKIEELEAA